MTDQPELRSVQLTRVFPASIERVWRAWTDAALVTRWMKCEPGVVLEMEGWHPSPGAEFTMKMTKPGEWENASTGRFVEVEAPRVLSYASGPDPEMGMPEMTVRVELREVEGGTELTLTHSGLPSDDMCDIVKGGWTGGLEQLEAVVAEAAAG